MRNVIIGTAGHIDHGKTCLIKALTGMDTDRLKEEKKRGITIENGFANLPNDRGYHLGIIDVPGHEKFIKNMLAGIGGIDIVLLVIALDEGIKPQTIEHFEIVKSLGIKSGIIVFTKMDKENVLDYDALCTQVRDLVKGSNLENAKMIPVSSMTGKNIDLLKNTIFDLVETIVKNERNEEKELTRLPIDRVFTIDGFGTIVTGTLIEGKIDTGDELMLYPSMKIVKVRQVESHGNIEPSAFAGQRTALNLINIKKEDIERGDVLAHKSSIIVSNIIDCEIKMFKSRTRDVKSNEKVFFNYGSKQTTAIIKIISNEYHYDEDNQNEPKLYVQFKFDEDVAIKRNDKFIIRFINEFSSFAGGTVLNIDSKKYKMKDDESIAHFENLKSDDENIVLYEMIKELSVDFNDIKNYSKRLNRDIKTTTSIINNLKKLGKIFIIPYSKQKKDTYELNDADIVISDKFYEGIKKYITDILNKFHKENAIQEGIKKEELKSTLFKRYNRIGDTVLENLITTLINDKIIKQNNDLISLYSFNIVIDEKKSNDIDKIIAKYKNAGFEPPNVDEIVEDYASGKSPKDKLEARQIIVDLAKKGILEKLTKEYYMYMDFYKCAVSKCIELFKNTDKIQMKDLRDVLNTSRKYAILLCDHFDEKKITKTVGDYRILLQKN